MADYPAGVITSAVALSTAAFDAKTLGGQWVVTANQSLVWSTTGQPVLLRPVKVPAGDSPAELTVVLPVSAQTGFVSAATGLPVNPTYTATYQPITAPLLTSVPFAVLAGETTKVASLLNVPFWPYATAIGSGPGGVASGAYTEYPTGSGLYLFVPNSTTGALVRTTVTVTAAGAVNLAGGKAATRPITVSITASGRRGAVSSVAVPITATITAAK